MTRAARKRIAFAVSALGCLALAAVLTLLATDVARLDKALVEGDVRFRRLPATASLWQAEELVPGAAGRAMLGIEGDLAFREALRSLRRSRLEDPVVSDPALAVRRNEAQARLESIVTSGDDDARRSRAAGLLGVLGLSRFVYETEEREALLATTIASLRLALDLDPGNDEAKYNLELAHQRGGGLQSTDGSAGQDPAPGGSGSKGAGASAPGSGY